MWKFILDHISEPWLGLVINVVLMIIAIWSVADAIFKGDKKLQWWMRITRRGKILIFSALAFVGISFLKDWNHDRLLNIEKAEQVLKESANKKELQIQDSVNKISLVNALRQADSSNQSANTIALAQFYLKAVRNGDSVIKIVRDSIRKVTNILPPDPIPLFGLCTSRERTNTKEIYYTLSDNVIDSFSFDLCSNNNVSNNIRLFSVLTIIRKNDTLNIAGWILRDSRMGTNAGYTPEVSIKDYKIDPLVIDGLYLRLIGTYENLPSSKAKPKTFLVNELYRYYPKLGRYDIQSVSYRDILDNSLRSKIKVLDNFLKRKSLSN